jgi:hypothetical protein
MLFMLLTPFERLHVAASLIEEEMQEVILLPLFYSSSFSFGSCDSTQFDRISGSRACEHIGKDQEREKASSSLKEFYGSKKHETRVRGSK